MIPVKICGITNRADAQYAVQSGACAVGFIFYEKSPRSITIEDARSISRHLPRSVVRVGVFVNHSEAFVHRAVSEVPLNVIQLHGDESAEFCGQFDVPVIKALRIQTKESLAAMQQFDVSAFLLDSHHNDHYGGTGKPFDWSLLGHHRNSASIILSGGLTPANILAAIEQVSPSAVDVNSGVESSPGRKDHEKMDRLFDQLRETTDTGFRFG